MFHRSQRLFLRPAFPEDSAAILAGVGEEAVMRNLALAPWPYGIADVCALAALAQDPRRPHFLITVPGTGVIGAVGLTVPGSAPADEPELGYWIARAHWGQGYATEAAGALLQIAQALGHRRVIARHFADNPASGKVLRKLGFLPTGRTGLRYSAGRGHAAESIEYARDLAADSDPTPFARAA